MHESEFHKNVMFLQMGCLDKVWILKGRNS